MAHIFSYLTSESTPIYLSHFDSNVCCSGKLSLESQVTPSVFLHVPRQVLFGSIFSVRQSTPKARNYLLSISESPYLVGSLAPNSCSMAICWVAICSWTNCGVPELTCKEKLFVPPPRPPLLVRNGQPTFMSHTPLSLQGCMIDLLFFFLGTLEGSMFPNVGVPKV